MAISIGAAEQLLNSLANASPTMIAQVTKSAGFTAATWNALKQIEATNNARAAAPAPTAPAPSQPSGGGGGGGGGGSTPNYSYQQLTAPGGPSLFGNNMKTAAGVSREAQMRAAAAALAVAQAAAISGNIKARDQALAAAQSASDQALRVGTATNTNFQNFQNIVTKQMQEIKSIKAPTAAPKDESPKNPGDGNGGSTFGTSYSLTPVPSYSTIPSILAPTVAVSATATKQPEVYLVQYDAETLPQELIEDLLFEDVGGSELISSTRQDIVDGQNVAYTIIKNLSNIKTQFNPNNILAGQISYNLELNQYALDIASKLPYINEEYPNGAVYLDADGNLVIEFNSIGTDEFAEAEISTNGTIYRIGA